MPGAVILLIHIVEPDHQRITREQALALAPGSELLELDIPFDRATATGRAWRVVARELDRKLFQLRRLAPERTIVVARAPIPVFAYLGAAMVRMGPVEIANDHQGQWQLFGPPRPDTPIADTFEAKPPALGRVTHGRVALLVPCSTEYSESADSFDRMQMIERVDYLGSYMIRRTLPKDQPMHAGELPALLAHVVTALEWIGARDIVKDALPVAIAGPNWVAFWIAHRLNPAVCGRLDFPNFVPGNGYVRALSFPMRKAPWLTGRAKLLLMHAEPKSMTYTGHGRNFDAVQHALERELGREHALEVQLCGAAHIREFMRVIETSKPDIVHMHLHGYENGDLAFEDERGEVARFTVAALIEQLRATRVRPALIVLNACHSAELAPAFEGIAECVIAYSAQIRVDAAVDFSHHFYGALARGNDLAAAIAQGKAGSGLASLEVESFGVEPSEMILMPRARTNPK